MRPADEAAQPERTALAWSRTLLATSALTGFVAVSAWRAHAPTGVAVALALLAAGLLLSASVVPRRVAARATEAVDSAGSAARPLPTLTMAALVCLLGAAALVVSVLSTGAHS